MRKINIIFTGLPNRETILLFESISELVKLRDEGIIDKIIYSTWTGELTNKYKDIASKLLNNKCLIIETDEPKDKSHGHLLQQMYAMGSGISILENDEYCLKTRNEMFIYPKLLRKLATEEGYLDIEDEFEIFEEKIWVPWFELTKPFYLSDECFFGKVSDMKKLINIDMSYETNYKIGCGINHIRRFIHPFLYKFPILYDYLNNHTNVGLFNTNRFSIIEEKFMEDEYLEILSVYYKILKIYFRIAGDYKQVTSAGYGKNLNVGYEWYKINKPRIDNNVFKDNFKIDKTWELPHGHIYAYNEVWLDNLLNNKLEEDNILNRMQKYL